MSKPLTPDLILAKAKTDSLQTIKKINLWGNDIDDLKLLRQMPNIEVLSLSVNKIASLKEFANCAKLQELYLRKNCISDLSEVLYLTSLQHLKILWLSDNPCCENEYYRQYIIKMLPGLVKLDNDPVTADERNAAAKLNINLSDYQISHKQEEQQSEDNHVLKNESKYTSSKGNQQNHLQKQKSQDEYIKNYETPTNIKREISSRERNEKPKSPSYVENSKVVVKNENIICAILTLMKELEDRDLEILKKDIEKAISRSNF